MRAFVKGVVVACAVVVAASGCGGSGSNTTPAGTQSIVPEAPSHTASAAQSPPVKPAVTPAARSTQETSGPTDSRATIRYCGAGDVRLALVNSRTTKNDGAISTDLELRNVSSRNCETRGFPGVSFTDAKGGAIGPPAMRRTGGATPLLGLSPGQTALAEVDTLAGPGAPCARPSLIVVYIPNSRQALRVPNTVPLYYCRASSGNDPQAPPAFAINSFRAGY
jgi:hypothetical protein